MDEIKGSIVNIERFRIDTDGEGVSSLVAMYGCNLECTYCANKECHISKYMKEVLATDVAKVLMKDALYLRATNGAVVFGGGEPLLQTEFIQAICKELDEDINIRIETALNISWEDIEPLTSIVDKWIVDIKDSVPKIYKSYTGLDNGQVLYNLSKLVETVGKDRIHVRVPRIKHYNDNISINITLEMLKEQWDIDGEVFDYIVGDVAIEEARKGNKLVIEASNAKKTEETPVDSGLSFLETIMQTQGNPYDVSRDYIEEFKFDSRKPYQIINSVFRQNNYTWLVATYHDIIMAEWEYSKCHTAQIIKSFTSLLDRYSLEELSHVEWYTGPYACKSQYIKLLQDHPEQSYVTLSELRMISSQFEMIYNHPPIDKISFSKNELKNELRQTKWSAHLTYSEKDLRREVPIIREEEDYEGELARDFLIKKNIGAYEEGIYMMKYNEVLVRKIED